MLILLQINDRATDGPEGKCLIAMLSTSVVYETHYFT